MVEGLLRKTIEQTALFDQWIFAQTKTVSSFDKRTISRNWTHYISTCPTQFPQIALATNGGPALPKIPSMLPHSPSAVSHRWFVRASRRYRLSAVLRHPPFPNTPLRTQTTAAFCSCSHLNEETFVTMKQENTTHLKKSTAVCFKFTRY